MSVSTTLWVFGVKVDGERLSVGVGRAEFLSHGLLMGLAWEH
jgi:hypothetical protein